MSFFIVLTIGFGIIGLGFFIKEEVVQIAAVMIGAIFCVWGLALTPKPLLIGAEILTVVALFRLCLHCCECD
ncbi:MAG: hypothetical protein HC820_00735 [Hydrococcus sp. RM1_1_31]|nr:hypothetical protein [Hydrococcus sp. RM1_1_31]